MARLDRLGPAAKEVAQIGSAIGREFSYELLAAIAQPEQKALHEALGELAKAGLVFQRGTPPDALYTFKHALVQDATYRTLLRSKRQMLHARIAAAVEERFPDLVRATPELLAHHNAEAGALHKAAILWLQLRATTPVARQMWRHAGFVSAPSQLSAHCRTPAPIVSLSSKYSSRTSQR